MLKYRQNTQMKNISLQKSYSISNLISVAKHLSVALASDEKKFHHEDYKVTSAVF